MSSRCRDCGCPLHEVTKRLPIPGADPIIIPPPPRCPPCQEAEDAHLQQVEIERRVKAAGVPARYRRYRFDRYVSQKRGEDPEAFMLRVLRLKETHIGISEANVATMRMHKDWRPEHKVWLYTYGPPGTGKTMATAAQVRTLVSVPRERRQVQPDELPSSSRWLHAYQETLERVGERGARRILPWTTSGGYSVLWVQENDLQREDALYRDKGRYNGMRDPIQRACEVQVLVLDDIGTARQSDAWKTKLESIINARYVRELPTVMTGNLPFRELQDHLGSARAFSRLEEMVTSPMALESLDWRKYAGGR